MRRGRQAEMRQRVRELVIVTILVWATHTLLSQWGYAAESFVPAAGGYRPASVELRAEAAVRGGEIRLRQVARWPQADNAALEQTGDLVIARFDRDATTLRLNVVDLKKTLAAAGVNLGGINFGGAITCRVNRIDSRVEPDAQAVTVTPARAEWPMLLTTGAPSTRPAVEEQIAPRTLRELLLADLSERFRLPANSFQLRFSPADERIAHLSEPHARFELHSRRERDLGLISWDLTLITAAGRQKASISADVKAWQTVLISERPLALKQPIAEQDVVEKRLLLDRLSEAASLKRHQVVGQQAARDIAPGTMLTGRMIEPVLLARVGQLVNVTVDHNGVRLKWVAEAREGGAAGQTIRVRKPGTREEFFVTLTAPQQGRLSSK